MIERHWKGIAKAEEADNYIQHLIKETFPKVSVMDGFKRASILRKTTDTGIEFLIITVWESIEAIMQFAGETADIAVVPLIVQKMMIAYDLNVSHYEIVANYDRLM
ncbi:MAG: hypothetical protein ABIS01_04270 [Ferruginibacter sp.]